MALVTNPSALINLTQVQAINTITANGDTYRILSVNGIEYMDDGQVIDNRIGLAINASGRVAGTAVR